MNTPDKIIPYFSPCDIVKTLNIHEIETCDISPCYIETCDILPCDITPCDILPCDIAPCYISPCDIVYILRV